MSSVTFNLGPVALIPLGEGRLFEAGDVTIAVFRGRDGRVHATEPWCPHRGGPLVDGIVAAGKVICPLHGYMFDLATGAPIHHECRGLRTYAARVSADDELLVTMRRRPKVRIEEAVEGAVEEVEPHAEMHAEPQAEGLAADA